MRIASVIVLPQGRWRRSWWSRPGVAGSAHAVEAEGAAGEHLVLRLGRQRPEPVAEHLRRAREEAVRVRIIGGPHDLVWPDVVGQHRVGRSLVKADGEVEVLGHLPERLVHRIADHLLAVIWVRPQEPAAHPELFTGEAHLVDRQLDRLHRQHRDPEQALGVRLAVIGKPAVVGVAHRGGEAGILDGAGEQAEARIEEGGVDAVGIHVDDARVRVEAAFAPLGVFQGAGLDDALSGAHGTQATDPPRITQQLAFDAQAFLAIVVDDEPRPALAEFGIDVLVPQVEGLEDVAVCVDCVVLARHRQSLRRRSNRCNTTVAAPGARASPLTRRWYYFAAAGNAGSLPMSRMSCWMTRVALRFATSCFMRSIEATVAARSKLKLGTPPLS